MSQQECKQPLSTDSQPSAPVQQNESDRSIEHIEASLSPLLEAANNVNNELKFTRTFGELIAEKPNAVTLDDVITLVNGKEEQSLHPCSQDCGWNTMGCVTCFWCCGSFIKLVPAGKYAIMDHSGRPYIIRPGWQFVSHPLRRFVGIYDLSQNLVQRSPVTICRVPVGSLGIANHGSNKVILLPGLHVRVDPTFTFEAFFKVNDKNYESGPIRMFTVNTGHVKICFEKGHVQILPAGRYFVNSANFVISSDIEIQQQSMRFEEHIVLLDGGIRLAVTGLLTYQITSVDDLVKRMGPEDLKRAIQDSGMAELARVFSGIHLEQISSQGSLIDENEGNNNREEQDDSGPSSVIGKVPKKVLKSQEGNNRDLICKEVMAGLQPIVLPWGVTIINFQLELIKIADPKFNQQYEEAGLAIANAKANARAAMVKNEIGIRTKEAEAKALLIETQGQQKAKLLKVETDCKAVISTAEAQAKARIIESDAIQESGNKVQSKFAQQTVFMDKQVEFAKHLKLTTLVTNDSSQAPNMLLNIRAPE